MIKYLIEYDGELHELIPHKWHASCSNCSLQQLCIKLDDEALCRMPTRYIPFGNFKKRENDGNTY